MHGAVQLNIHHVTRVEGHGNITVNVRDGEIEECRLEIVESPRFFEVMLQGRSYRDAAHITSRICGICSVGHTTASIRATESALGIEPTEQTLLLRKLILHGETLQSHILHIYFLAAPDFLGAPSVIPLARTHTDVVLRALRLKKLANDLCDLIGGRSVHPVAMMPGGFTSVPTIAGLQEVRARLEAAMADMVATAELLATLDIPKFERETEYISLKRPDEYAFYDGELYSSDTGIHPVSHYRRLTNEQVVQRSTAKHAHANRDSFAVGALARYNNNFDRLNPFAKEIADEMSLPVPCFNPFMTTAAQVVECAHAVADGIALIDELIGRGVQPEPLVQSARLDGQGIGAVEVPRGILYHDYQYADGRITRANCIIPTGQNVANIEADMRFLVPQILDKPEAEIAQNLEMLVRAYDPCISCSAHMLDVKFVGKSEGEQS